MCSIDAEEPSNLAEATGRWFTEWGEIFEAIPDKFRTYNADDYDFNYISIITESDVDKPTAVDIFDPGCSVCMTSYRNQKAAGFFDEYDVHLVPFAIQDATDAYKFKNSEIIVKYMLAAEQIRSGLAVELLDHIFEDKDSDGLSYQTLFNEDFSHEEAVSQLEKWLLEAGLEKSGVAEIRKIVDYPETGTKMLENRNIIENELKIKGIPTAIYNGKKHTGLWQE